MYPYRQLLSVVSILDSVHHQVLSAAAVIKRIYTVSSSATQLVLAPLLSTAGPEFGVAHPSTVTVQACFLPLTQACRVFQNDDDVVVVVVVVVLECAVCVVVVVLGSAPV